MRENVNGLVKRLKVPGEFITANEALVYKVESEAGLKAWKIYPGFPIETIVKYQTITEMAASYANDKPWKIATEDGLLEFPFTWRVVPIEEVREYQGCPLAISEWIDGLSVQDLLERQEELGELNHQLQTINATDYGAVLGDMTAFSETLNKDLKTSNIWLTTVNAKPIDTQLVVTDVCPSVKNLTFSF